MSVIPLRPIHRFSAVGALPRPAAAPQPGLHGFVTLLMRNGLVAPHQVLQAIALHKTQRRLTETLLAQQAISPQRLYDSLAQHWSVGVARLHADPPDPRLTQQISSVTALREGLLPWRKIGEATVIVTAYPEEFTAHKPWLTEKFGQVIMALAPLQEIEAALLALHGPQLAQAAETRVTAQESCRNFTAHRLRTRALIVAGLVSIMAFLTPLAVLKMLFAVAILAMIATNLLKLATLTQDRAPPPEHRNRAIIAQLPTVSVMVALYREDNIAQRLTQRLEQLDYPRDLLDILLVVEAEDHLTRAALAKSSLPSWMRVIVVPAGSVKTKPRALNYALDHCRGSIIGVYDAEDAPEADQLRKVVDRFYQRGAEVACLQGKLDYYNPRSTWLSRCFTIEYAAWFRLFLPGLARLGLAIPLGGTTLFFRRAALEALGGWDAQNVTEDADLGLRLYRHGYRTELIDTTTYEEANCHGYAWIKQRSRWIKGYMMTYITHMRDPALLWRQLGAKRFIGFQAQFLANILQCLLAPLIWSFWGFALGLQHPLATDLPPLLRFVATGLMISSALIFIYFDIKAMRKTRHRLSPLWALTLIAYQPLATLAAYRALWELLTKPFYWEKTRHGLYDV
jgi:glycosyltransferase XagB